MLKKGTKLYSMFTGSCPKCHEESMFKNKNPYILSEALSMHETCSNCDTKYKIEPSFFYGAMYVSYGVGVAFAVAAFIIAFLMFQTSLINSFIAIIVTLIVFMPFIIRVSRNIWINFFVKYDPQATSKVSS